MSHVILSQVLTVVFHNKLNRTTIAMTITGTNSAGNKTLVVLVIWLPIISVAVVVGEV